MNTQRNKAFEATYPIVCESMNVVYDFRELDSLMEPSRQFAINTHHGQRNQVLEYMAEIWNASKEYSRSKFLSECHRPDLSDLQREKEASASKSTGRRLALVLHTGRHDGVTKACCQELARIGNDVVILFADTKDEAIAMHMEEAVHLVERFGGKAIALARLPFWKINTQPSLMKNSKDWVLYDHQVFGDISKAMGRRPCFDVIGMSCV